jgi:pullulanase/glycogen debranching enzyme
MNASGCGNETASEREPFRNYMVQSVLYWAREYHVDGFRFDLMAVHDVETMNLIREELDRLPEGKNILLYGEPWAALAPDLHAPNLSANKETLPLLSDRIGVFSDATRDTVNGSVFNPCEACGYAGGWIESWMEKSVKSAVCGWCRKDLDHYTKSPTQLVQYVSSHDNYTLWDSLTLRAGDGDFHRNDAERIQRVRLTSGIYLTSVGLAFFQSGEEFGRTKEGCGNSYNGPAVRNRLDWALTEQRKELVDWYRGLIGLRKELVRREELTVDYVDHITFLSVPDSCVGFVTPEKTGTIWKRFVIFYNPHRDRLIHTNLPEGVWELLCDGENSLLWQQARPATCTGAYQLPPCSVIIFGERA